jgi:hypothetical protein
LKGRSSFFAALEEARKHSAISSQPKKKAKNQPKTQRQKGMYDFAGKCFCSRLRDLGCPDTLIKDVRDVAAAVCAARGRDESRKKV